MKIHGEIFSHRRRPKKKRFPFSLELRHVLVGKRPFICSILSMLYSSDNDLLVKSKSLAEISRPMEKTHFSFLLNFELPESVWFLKFSQLLTWNSLSSIFPKLFHENSTPDFSYRLARGERGSNRRRGKNYELWVSEWASQFSVSLAEK